MLIIIKEKISRFITWRHSYALAFIGLTCLFTETALSENIDNASTAHLPRIGVFSPDMTVIEALQAAPNYPWDYYPFGHYDVPKEFPEYQKGAIAHDALDWKGDKWTVKIGTQYDFPSYVTDIRISKVFETTTHDECRKKIDKTIIALEAIIKDGFGHHPDFDNPNPGKNGLYLDFDKDTKILPIGAQSRIRYWENPVSGTNANFVSYYEPPSSEFYRVGLKASSLLKYEECTVSLSMFMPYQWDEQAEKFIVPPALHQRFPGRYKEKDDFP